MPPIDASTQLSVTLTAEQWNALLAVIGDAPAPYRITAPIIQAIGTQVQQAAADMAAAPKTNGPALAPRYNAGEHA